MYRATTPVEVRTTCPLRARRAEIERQVLLVPTYAIIILVTINCIKTLQKNSAAIKILAK
jgi:hypothetical protein